MQYFVEACHRINKKNGKKCFWARIEDIMANPRKVFDNNYGAQFRLRVVQDAYNCCRNYP